MAAISTLLFAGLACSSSTGSDADATAPIAPTPVASVTDTAQSEAPDATAGTTLPGASSSTPAIAPPPAEAPAARNRIAVTSADGSIFTVGPDGSSRVKVAATNPGVPGGLFAAFYAWPTWSPDGRHLLVSAFTPDAAGGFQTSLLRASPTTPDAIPELLYRDIPGTTGIGGVPHFPVWHPGGGSLALIANVGDGLATFLVDVEEGMGSAVSNGSPVYLDWSSDGSQLLVHTAERLVLHQFGEDGRRVSSEQIGSGSVSYRVPQFSPTSSRYAYIDLADGERALYLGDPEQDAPRKLRTARTNSSFAWSPDGSRLAFADGNRASFYETLRIIDTGNGETRDVIVQAPSLAFWWSPDGQSILFVMPGGEPENAAMAIVDTASGEINVLGLIAPSAEMGFVISFFDQYAADLRLWSPDSSHFVFSGELKQGFIDEDAGTRVQLGDPSSEVWVIDPSGSEPPLSLGAGGFATWAPN